MLESLSNAWKMRAFLLLAAIYLGSFLASCTEIKYMIWGEKTNATVTQCTMGTVAESRRSTREVLGVKYEFTQKDGTLRKGIMNRSLDWEPDPDGTFAIEYLPDKYQAERLEGESDHVGVVIFLVMTGVIVGYLALIVRRTQ